MVKRKTRVLSTDQGRERMAAGCPSCGTPLVLRTKRARDEDGTARLAGTYFSCADYPASCGYYFSAFSDPMREAIVEENNGG